MAGEKYFLVAEGVEVVLQDLAEDEGVELLNHKTYNIKFIFILVEVNADVLF
jgi:hypothetical protein